MDNLIFDLQLFAEEEETVTETTEETTTEETEVEETEVEEQEEETAEPEPEPKREESVPLPKYMEERKKRQELERVLTQQRAEQDRLRLQQDLINRGWPEKEAELQAREKVEERQRQEEISAKLLDYDIKDLAKSDPFFSDAEAFADELKEIMRDKKVSAEEAYLLRRGKTRAREIQIENEQRAAAKRKPTTTKKVETASPTPPRNPYKLSETDRKALEGLKKHQPEAGWSEKKFYEMFYPKE